MISYLVIWYQSGSILLVSEVHKIVSKPHNNCKQTICVKNKIVLTKNLWKKQNFVILAFYVKQNTLSKSLMSSLETVENCYSLFMALTTLNEKWAKIVNHWNNNFGKNRLAKECKKIWEGKARWAEITFFPSATSCLSWRWHTHYHSADKNLLLSFKIFAELSASLALSIIQVFLIWLLLLPLYFFLYVSNSLFLNLNSSFPSTVFPRIFMIVFFEFLYY